MQLLFGQTRDVVKRNYALRTPAGHVPSCLPGWTNVVPIVQISPAMGARFCQLQITFEAGGEGRGNTGGDEYFVFVLSGSCSVKANGKKSLLRVGGFAYLPPQTEYHFASASAGARLLLFQKTFQTLDGCALPETIIGQENKIAGTPFLGHKDAILQVLLPNDPSFDLAVNIFTYQPGATLPFVETHVMEHGLLMLQGQGIYRLGDDWHPVQEGDVIWMAPYCPQWFVAMGPVPGRYIYYKDVNRTVNCSTR